MVNYTQEEQKELEDKYRFLHHRILITDGQLKIAQRKEPETLGLAKENRDRTITLIEENGFTWRITREKVGLFDSKQLLQIWNSDIHFGFTYIIEANWHD